MAGLTFGSKRMQGWSFVELFADERLRKGGGRVRIWVLGHFILGLDG